MDMSIAERQCCCPTTTIWEVFRCLQPFRCPFHSTTTLASRLSRAWMLVQGHVERIKFMLEPDWSADPDAVCSSKEGTPLIHTVSNGIGFLIAVRLFPPMGRKLLPDWDEFAQEVVRKSDINKLATYWEMMPVTPLIGLLWRVSIHSGDAIDTRPKYTQLMIRGLRKWLQILKASDIDLTAYGARENAILQASEETRNFWSLACKKVYRSLYRSIGRHSGQINWKCYNLLGFKYGPNVEDWDIRWDEPTDKFAGQFWNLVESPSIRIPGEWYEAEDF